MQTSETVTAAGLLRASFAQIARNRRQILPIMALIWLLQLPSFFSEAVFLPLDVMELIGLPPGVASMVPAIIVMLAVYLGTAWSAVGWHRLTLLGEQPAAVLPRWHAQPVIAYFAVSFFLPLLTWGLPALPAFLLVYVMQALNAPLPLTVLPAVLAVIVAIWLSLRLSPVQVSRAVQRPISIDEAFRRTAHMARPLWKIALLGMLGLAAIIGITWLVANLLTDPEGYYYNDAAMFLDGTIFWLLFVLFFLIAVSVFNTIYRHIGPDIVPDRTN